MLAYLGLWWSVVVGVLEFTISASTGGGRSIALRAVVATLVGIFTAAPVMLAAFDNRIEQRMEADARARKQAQMAASKETLGLPRVRTQIDTLKKRRRAAQDAAARARRI